MGAQLPVAAACVGLVLVLLASDQAIAARLWPAEGESRIGQTTKDVAVGYVEVVDPEDGQMKIKMLDGRGAKLDPHEEQKLLLTSPAIGTYIKASSTKSNFGQLRLTTSSAFPDGLQMRAMGFVEGYLTAQAIADHWYNMQWWLGTQANATKYAKLRSWLLDQETWMRAQITANSKDNNRGEGKDEGGEQQQQQQERAFWDAQALIMQQVDGLVAGYNAAAAAAAAVQSGGSGGEGLSPLTTQDIMLLNAFGDIDDLLPMMDLELGGHAYDAANENGASDKSEGGAKSEEARRKSEEAGRKSEEGGPRLHPAWDSVTPGQARARIAKSGRCSALIKVTNDLSDILIGHTTWWSYTSLLRIYKHYTTRLANPAIKCQRMSFPSYPALVSSMDDFYVLSTGLVVTETSNDVYDLDLYSLSSNQAALSWHRTRAANMLADNGPHWAEVARMYNSGTYNNQYMVVDLKLFEPGEQLRPGLLTVAEIMPGGWQVADTTQELERGYWPSYNIPYFPEVYNRTGYPGVREHLRSRGRNGHGNGNGSTRTGATAGAAAAGASSSSLSSSSSSSSSSHAPSLFDDVVAGLSYQVAPRAKIFRRDSGDVRDLSGIKRVLRSNGWRSSNVENSHNQNSGSNDSNNRNGNGHGSDSNSVGSVGDPFSPSPWDAICARGDLDPDSPDAYGCYDAKVTSYRLALALQAEAVNGPAWAADGNGQPPFSWAKWKGIAHRGMIDTYRTEFELHEP